MSETRGNSDYPFLLDECLAHKKCSINVCGLLLVCDVPQAISTLPWVFHVFRTSGRTGWHQGCAAEAHSGVLLKAGERDGASGQVLVS